VPAGHATQPLRFASGKKPGGQTTADQYASYMISCHDWVSVRMFQHSAGVDAGGLNFTVRGDTPLVTVKVWTVV
jgi:hypothetical protein